MMEGISGDGLNLKLSNDLGNYDCPKKDIRVLVDTSGGGGG